jgi:drug/metabolite transporter (DMT)-like permease
VILFIGLVLLLSKGNIERLLELEFTKGDLFMAIAACLFGLYTVLLPRKKSGNFSFVAATIVLGELMLLPLFIGEQLLTDTPLTFTGISIFQLMYIGIGPSIVSFYLWNKSIATIGSTKAATIYNTLPIYSAFFAFIFLGETILLIQIISSIVIIAGVLLVIQNKD